VHEVIPWAGHVNYAASKGGVMMMMKSIAQETAPHRIRVNSVCPGPIRTPINTSAWSTPEAYADLMKLVPYKRIGEVDDIGRVVAWLASDEADYITLRRWRHDALSGLRGRGLSMTRALGPSRPSGRSSEVVMPGLDPGIHVPLETTTGEWIAGSTKGQRRPRFESPGPFAALRQHWPEDGSSPENRIISGGGDGDIPTADYSLDRLPPAQAEHNLATADFTRRLLHAGLAGVDCYLGLAGSAHALGSMVTETNPRTSVVDRHGKVHGMEGLYVGDGPRHGRIRLRGSQPMLAGRRVNPQHDPLLPTIWSGEYDRSKEAWTTVEAYHRGMPSNITDHSTASRFEEEQGAMPTYAYRCGKCGETFEKVETISEHGAEKPLCPKCGSENVTSIPTTFVAMTGKKS
jgi:putative FmdB family regulatory protein